jgi:CRP-like cAMP-binding protein
VHRASRSGERRALNVIEEPGSFGEIALLDQRPRSATVEALEPCELFAVSREAFLGLLGRDPRLVDGVLRELGRMVRRLSDQLADDSLLDLPTRVAKTLLRLVDAQVDGAAQPAVALSKTKLAELAGGSRQSVNAALSTLSSRAMPDGHGGSRPASRPGASRRRITPQISDPLRRCGSGCQHSALPSIDGAVPRRRRP